MAPGEVELINKARNGDSASFEELICKYDRQVLSLALKYVNDPDDAKDIYQEVFIRVFKGIKNFKFNSEFSTWLFRITTNVCFTFKSRQKKHPQYSISESYEEPDDEKNYVMNIRDENISPEKTVLNTEISENINKALNSLSPKQKMIFLLKHYEGYKIREIAAMLNIGEGTIKKYLFEAVHKMRNQLKEVYG